ncbi:MAG: zinc ribbon domain-containing protein, partial [Azovibrio sp.]|nr:zinc ribbon domain-containing protein [Azovibrio sp.]
MFCNKCGTEAVADAKFCSNCGGPLIQMASTLVAPSSSTPPPTDVSAESSDGFFAKLSRGDFGLARTYWLYGVLVGVIVNIVVDIVFSIIKSPGFLAIALLAYTAYEVPVIMGIWRAATKYTGPKIWAVLAKIACVLGALMLA